MSLLNDQNKTVEEQVDEIIMKWAEANDADLICMLACDYYQGLNGFQQDHEGQSNYLLNQQSLVVVRRILP